MGRHAAFVFIGLLLCFYAGLAAAKAKFKILHFNDFHSRIEPDSEGHGHCFKSDKDQGRCHGGMARLKKVIDLERADNMTTFVLNAGDDFVGTIWNTRFKGKANAYFMNKLGITAMTLGNHEFDWGPDVLLQFVKSINYPVISSNFRANGHPLGKFVKKYITLHADGMKIGVCGPSTLYTNTGSKPYPAHMDDWLSATRDCVTDLKEREGAKIIIVMTHVGFQGDQKIAREVPDVDLVIGGHTHAFLYSGTPPLLSKKDGTRDHPVGSYPLWIDSHFGKRVPVVQAKAFGRYLGRLVLEFDDDGHLVNLDGNPILLGDRASENWVPMDGTVEQEVKDWRSW